MTGIGNTPLIKLTKMVPEGAAEVWVKWEGANPTGSMKDRMAQAIVDEAAFSGRLKPGGTLFDFTGGSTGSSISMICATRGFKAHFITSDAFGEAKLRTMRAFGATVEVIPSDNMQITPDLFVQMRARVNELESEPGYVKVDQFVNPANKQGYYSLAREALTELGQIDGFVQCVGTGGSFTGVAEILKEANSATFCVPIEPANCRALSGGALGGHRIEGVGPGFVAELCRLELADDIYAVTDRDAMRAARELAVREGVFGGTSSGANVWAAVELAKRLGAGKKVLAIVCDSGLKYLYGELY